MKWILLLFNIKDTLLSFQSVAQRTEKQIKEEFEKLHHFLTEEEKARIATLKEEEKEKIKRLNENVKEVKVLRTSLSGRIKKIQDDMTSDDSLFLHVRIWPDLCSDCICIREMTTCPWQKLFPYFPEPQRHKEEVKFTFMFCCNVM